MRADLLMKRGDSASWAAANPVLKLGEPGYDTSLRLIKMGDGVTPWATLPFLAQTLPVTLTDAATINTNAALGNHYRVTLGGNRTLANPTNPTNGQKGLWELIQDGTGNRTLTYGSAFAFGVDVPSAVLTTTASKRDFMGAIYNSTTAKWYVLAFTKGY
jgi:hypothetical protein